jgi:hypothetical protein
MCFADQKDLEFSGRWNHSNPDDLLPGDQVEGESTIDNQTVVVRRA